MALSPDLVGTALPPVTTTLERGRVAFFARTIGDTDLVHSDIAAARAAGHPDLLVPPTFLFGMRFERPDPFDWLVDAGIDLTKLLHGTQSFEYQRDVHAGEVVTLSPVITAVYEKKGWALGFLETTTSVTDAEGQVVATLHETLVIRNEVAA